MKAVRPASSVAAVQEARRFWSRRYGRILSPEEAEEIHRGLIAFFGLMLSWEARARKEDDADPTNTGANDVT